MPQLRAALEQLHTAIVATLPENETVALLKQHPRLTPTQLIGIYQESYHLRLQAAVRADYPATLHFLGEKAEPLIADFVRQTPSDNYNLDRYSLGFAGFVAAQGLAAAADLAALEAALTEAFMFQDTPALAATALAGMDESTLGATRFTLQQSVRLLHLKYDAADYFAAHNLAAALPAKPRHQTPQNLCQRVCASEGHHVRRRFQRRADGRDSSSRRRSCRSAANRRLARRLV